MNPMINAGAIATTGLVAEQQGADPMSRIMETFGRYAGRKLDIDETVYRSESDTGHRNRAIAHLLYGHGILDREPEQVLDLYFRQCSILVTARDLAMMGACLANNGVNPVTGVVALKSRYVEKVLSVMSTCGMYDYSGGWIFNVGMPAKSGVGGGIMAVLPGQFGLGVFSPRLDEKGNSVRGIEACKRLSNDFNLHLFQVARSTSASVIRQVYDSAKFGSRRRRSATEYNVLASEGHRVRVYDLQGELLFGSAEAVSLEMLSTFPDIDVLVVDLRRVVALDAASSQILADVCSCALGEGKYVFFTNCRHLYRFRRHIEKLGGDHQTPGWLAFEDTDHAVQWGEDRILRQAEIGGALGRKSDLSEQYLCVGMSSEELQAVQRVGEMRRFAAGTRIFSAGDQAESMFFIAEGEVDVSVNSDAGHPVRLTTLGPGTVFGEVALLNQNERTADVTAAADTQCLEVRFDALGEPMRTRMLINMASYFASKIAHDAELLKHLG
jgi:glutaminase